jgi:hypothetical protein
MEQLPVEIFFRSEVITMTSLRIAHLLRQGLTAIDCQMLALTADAHRTTVAELMRRALESEARL